MRVSARHRLAAMEAPRRCLLTHRPSQIVFADYRTKTDSQSQLSCPKMAGPPNAIDRSMRLERASPLRVFNANCETATVRESAGKKFGFTGPLYGPFPSLMLKSFQKGLPELTATSGALSSLELSYDLKCENIKARHRCFLAKLFRR